MTTIHQPSSKAFYFFDRLILMMDGHIVYQGAAVNAPAYFGKIGSPVPQFANPTDFFLMTLQVNYPKAPEDEARVANFRGHYDKVLRQAVKEEGALDKFENNLDELLAAYYETGFCY